MLLNNEKEIAKEIAEKLLTIMPEGMLNVILRFVPFEANSGYSIILNYTKPDGYVAHYTDEDILSIDGDFRNVRRYIGDLLLDFRRSSQEEWERSLVWVNKDGECDIDFLYW